MAADIDTAVYGNSGSCRRAADWLGRAAAGVDSNVSAIGRAQSASESCWQGTAADEFRGQVGRIGADADRLSAAATHAQAALNAFAADLDTVTARMNQARAVAAAAGLTVTPTTIEPPGAAPARVYGPISASAAAALFRARSEYNDKVNAYNEALQTVTDARQIESQAHAKLTAPMRESSGTVGNLQTIGRKVTDLGLAYVKEVSATAGELYEKADDIAEHAERMEQLALDAELSDAGRAAAARAGELSSAGATETADEAARIERMVGRVPASVRKAIAANPGDLLADGTGLLKVGKGVLKGIPFAGSGLQVFFAGMDVVDGDKSIGQAAVGTGLSLAGAAVGGAAGAELGAAAGSVVPFVGTAVGGIVGAIAGGLIGSVAGERAGDELTGH